jgi:hypothetical protein
VFNADEWLDMDHQLESNKQRGCDKENGALIDGRAEAKEDLYKLNLALNLLTMQRSGLAIGNAIEGAGHLKSYK